MERDDIYLVSRASFRPFLTVTLAGQALGVWEKALGSAEIISQACARAIVASCVAHEGCARRPP